MRLGEDGGGRWLSATEVQFHLVIMLALDDDSYWHPYAASWPEPRLRTIKIPKISLTAPLASQNGPGGAEVPSSAMPYAARRCLSRTSPLHLTPPFT